MKTRIVLKSLDALSFSAVAGSSETIVPRGAPLHPIFEDQRSQRNYQKHRAHLTGLLQRVPTVDSPLNDL